MRDGASRTSRLLKEKMHASNNNAIRIIFYADRRSFRFPFLLIRRARRYAVDRKRIDRMIYLYPADNFGYRTGVPP